MPNKKEIMDMSYNKEINKQVEEFKKEEKDEKNMSSFQKHRFYNEISAILCRKCQPTYNNYGVLINSTTIKEEIITKINNLIIEEVKDSSIELLAILFISLEEVKHQQQVKINNVLHKDNTKNIFEILCADLQNSGFPYSKEKRKILINWIILCMEEFYKSDKDYFGNKENNNQEAFNKGYENFFNDPKNKKMKTNIIEIGFDIWCNLDNKTKILTKEEKHDNKLFYKFTNELQDSYYTKKKEKNKF